MTGIMRGKFIGKRVDGPPADETEHFIKCEACGGWIDCRDSAACSTTKGRYRILTGQISRETSSLFTLTAFALP